MLFKFKNTMISLLFFLISIGNSLTCGLYDFSNQVVVCASVCPINTILVGNKCLTSNQFITDNGEVHICNGYVSNDKMLCCDFNQYIFNNLCLNCSGSTYNQGYSCCNSGYYVDMSSTVVNCIKISTGICSWIDFDTPNSFKICCLNGNYYNI